MEQGRPPGFGEVLRRYRAARELTQEGLAERAGVSARTVSDLERGINVSPRKDTLLLLAEALQLSDVERQRLEDAARAETPPPFARPSGAATPPLVGRAAELALLARHVAGEGPPVLLLAGEPGIGKSRLLQMAAERARDHGWRVLEGGCQRRGGQEPYAPLLGALQRYLRGRSPAQARGELQGCAWLVRLLPELADGAIEPLPAWSLSPEHEHRLMTAAAVRFLANVAGPTGTLLVLDDLHWAGPEALELLATLVRTAAAPLRVVGAYRDSEVGANDPLSTLLADLAQAGLVARRLIDPLSYVDAADLLATLLVGTTGTQMTAQDAILRRAGGVPYFLMSWVQAVGQGEQASTDAALPWSVAQSVLQRVRALPEVSREVLGVAAVIGRVAPRPLLAAVVAQPENALVAALDAACRARLLEEHGDDAYRFVHDMIRETVEADLGAARRAMLHRQVAGALERRPGSPPAESLAYHYGCTDEHLKAGCWLERAGDEAAAGFANVSAIADYTAARERLIAGGADAATLSCLDEKLGDVRLLMSAYAEAQRDFARARTAATEAVRRADLWRKEGVAWEKLGEYDRALPAFVAAEAEGGPEGTALPALLRAEIELGRSNVYLAQGLMDAAEAAAARALDQTTEESLTAATGRIRAWASWHQAMASWARGDLARMDECFGRMRTIAESIDDQHSLGRAWHGLGMALWMRGDLVRAEERTRSALAILEVVGEQAAIGMCWNILGLIALERGDLAQAADYLQRTLVLFEQTGHQSGLLFASCCMGDLAWSRGDLAQAEEYVRRGLAIAQRFGDQDYIADAWRALGDIACERGELRKAFVWCREARHLARREGYRPREAEASLAHARACLRGVPTRSRLRLAAAVLAHGRMLATTHGIGAKIMEGTLLTAELHLRQGALPEAQATAEEALGLAMTGQRRREEALAHRLLGQCAQARGAHDEAAGHLRTALALLEAMGAALEAARTRAALAVTLAAPAGEGTMPVEARSLLAAAIAQFATSGAALDRTQAEQVSASPGRPSVHGGASPAPSPS
jgi:tetratricopeptide (TPR) repeat protein/transcriptional regulator with XRE-family HTH domain